MRNARGLARSAHVERGLDALRQRGLYDKWAAAAGGETRDAMATTVAGMWIPVELAMRHYRACEALGLSHDEALAIGSSVGAHIRDSMLLMIRRVANGGGVTPGTPGGQY